MGFGRSVDAVKKWEDLGVGGYRLRLLFQAVEGGYRWGVRKGWKLILYDVYMRIMRE